MRTNLSSNVSLERTSQAASESEKSAQEGPKQKIEIVSNLRGMELLWASPATLAQSRIREMRFDNISLDHQ